MIKIQLIKTLVCMFLSMLNLTQGQLRSPSLYQNCGCQCNSYTFSDIKGYTQGNCFSSDFTGGRWCYVDYGNTCHDAVPSLRYNGQWSYEACSTPRCYYNNNNGFYNYDNYNGFSPQYGVNNFGPPYVFKNSLLRAKRALNKTKDH
uniref:Uncharacterized protein n=1 Tax=Lepeophtheirus salmonis TaxID=72036 RepID=A0A0K2U2L1_LEPSM|nr:uncharacterized protein LOC121116720 [Lepeophtheirus salmonis]